MMPRNTRPRAGRLTVLVLGALVLPLGFARAGEEGKNPLRLLDPIGIQRARAEAERARAEAEAARAQEALKRQKAQAEAARTQEELKRLEVDLQKKLAEVRAAQEKLQGAEQEHQGKGGKPGKPGAEKAAKEAGEKPSKPGVDKGLKGKGEKPVKPGGEKVAKPDGEKKFPGMTPRTVLHIEVAGLENNPEELKELVKKIEQLLPEGKGRQVHVLRLGVNPYGKALGLYVGRASLPPGALMMPKPPSDPRVDQLEKRLNAVTQELEALRHEVKGSKEGPKK